MFKIIYSKSVKKDIKNISKQNLIKIKQSIEELHNFPNISSIKRLKNYHLCYFRLKVENYRIFFDVDWKNKEIHILKITHRKDLY